ncbi:MAG: signal peptidase I [Specibacter sp.]
MTRRDFGGLVFLMSLILLSRRFRLFRVSGWSMDPVLKHDAILLVNAASYRGRRLPKASDVVVFRDPRHLDRYLVKRIIATPGETVKGVGGNILITDNPSGGRSRCLAGTWDWSPATVPPEHYVVFGDNTGFSKDSRTWGFLPACHILGKAIVLRRQRPGCPGVGSEISRAGGRVDKMAPK